MIHSRGVLSTSSSNEVRINCLAIHGCRHCSHVNLTQLQSRVTNGRPVKQTVEFNAKKTIAVNHNHVLTCNLSNNTTYVCIKTSTYIRTHAYVLSKYVRILRYQPLTYHLLYITIMCAVYTYILYITIACAVHNCLAYVIPSQTENKLPLVGWYVVHQCDHNASQEMLLGTLYQCSDHICTVCVYLPVGDMYAHNPHPQEIRHQCPHMRYNALTCT